MAKITKEVLRNQLHAREFAPVYVLHGPESFLRDGAVRYLADQAFADGELRDFNDNAFTLNDPNSIRSAIAAADQLPMMASRRVVRITDVRIGATAQRDSLKEEFLDLLTGYLERPSPHSIVVFIADELNGNRKITKALDRFATMVEFQELRDNELTQWIAKEFGKLGCSADASVVKHLASICGSGLRRLTNEISKLAVAAQPDGRVDIEMVDSLVANSCEIDNFALTDQLVSGRSTQALATVKKILDDGAEPLALLGLLSYNYRRLLMVKEMMSEGVERAEVARVAKLRYSDQEAFLASARKTRRSDLLNTIDRLAAADLAIKSSIGGGKSGSRMVLEMLVCELADPR